MTEALREITGDALYGTLVNGLRVFRSGWLRQVPQRYFTVPPTRITQEGVDGLAAWRVEDFDSLSGIGPKKAGLIYKAFQELHASEGESVRDETETS